MGQTEGRDWLVGSRAHRPAEPMTGGQASWRQASPTQTASINATDRLLRYCMPTRLAWRIDADTCHPRTAPVARREATSTAPPKVSITATRAALVSQTPGGGFPGAVGHPYSRLITALWHDPPPECFVWQSGHAASNAPVVHHSMRHRASATQTNAPAGPEARRAAPRRAPSWDARPSSAQGRTAPDSVQTPG